MIWAGFGPSAGEIMKAIKTFQGVPDGEFYPVTYEPGDDVPPELEASARYFAGQQSASIPDSGTKKSATPGKPVNASGVGPKK